MKFALPRPHPTQQYVIKHARRFNLVICGRRWGKTELGAILAILVALDGYPVAWLAPTYKQLRAAWRTIVELIRPIATRIDKTEGRIEFVTGGCIDFWGLSSGEVQRGRKYKRIIWDEAAMYKNQTMWQAVVKPLLVDYQGDIFFLTTPNGMNWIYPLYSNGLDDTKPEWKSFHFTSYDNPFISKRELDADKELLPDRIFRQEYLAEFIQDGGAVFRGVDRVSKAERQIERLADHNYVFGVDWGKSNDFTVIHIFDKTINQQADMIRFNQVSYEIQKDRLVDAIKKWQPTRILAESNSIGEPMIDALRKIKLAYGVIIPPDPTFGIGEMIEYDEKNIPIKGFAMTGQSKGPLIESFALDIERDETVLLNDKVQIAELMSYELDRLPSGKYTYSAPSGGHDDTVIAGALANDLRQKRGVMGSHNPFFEGNT